MFFCGDEGDTREIWTGDVQRRAGGSPLLMRNNFQKTIGIRKLTFIGRVLCSV